MGISEPCSQQVLLLPTACCRGGWSAWQEVGRECFCNCSRHKSPGSCCAHIWGMGKGRCALQQLLASDGSGTVPGIVCFYCSDVLHTCGCAQNKRFSALYNNNPVLCSIQHLKKKEEIFCTKCLGRIHPGIKSQGSFWFAESTTVLSSLLQKQHL